MPGQTLMRPAPTSISLKLLASSLDKYGDDPQLNSALCQLPKWLRSRIWRDVFTAEDVPITYSSNAPFQYESSRKSRPRTHTAVLRTCRAVYREACPYSITLNPAHGAAEHLSSKIPSGVLALHPDIPDYVTTWQFATLPSLVIHTDRDSLEGVGGTDGSEVGVIAQYATSWLLAAERSHGVFVAGKDEPDEPSAWQRYRKHHSTHEIEDPRNRYRARLWNDNNLSESYTLTMGGDMSLFVENGTISPYYQAERISSLTVRIDRQDWSRETRGEDKRPRLALDPSFSSCTATGEAAAEKMQQAAQDRRIRCDRREPPLPYPQHSWGRDVACFPNLNCFTLHLEAFPEEVEELDRVVDCAKLWTFPLGSDDNPPDERLGPRTVLEWDGRVEEYRWGQEHVHRSADGYGDDTSARSGFEVRVISFRPRWP